MPDIFFQATMQLPSISIIFLVPAIQARIVQHFCPELLAAPVLITLDDDSQVLQPGTAPPVLVIPFEALKIIHEQGIMGYLLPNLEIHEGTLVCDSPAISTSEGMRLTCKDETLYMYLDASQQWQFLNTK